SGAASVPSLTTANPLATTVLQVTLHTPAPANTPRLALNILQAGDDWLQVNPDLTELERLRDDAARESFRSFAIPLRALLRPGAELSGTPRPLGFLVELKVDGRTYHHRVTLP